jgi:hypothetical protein
VAVVSVLAQWAKPSAVKRLLVFEFLTGVPTVMRPSFADDGAVTLPTEWDCPRCGLPAGRDKENPPAPPKNEPYKTHLAYVKERRSDVDGTAILEEALRKLRGEE